MSQGPVDRYWARDALAPIGGVPQPGTRDEAGKHEGQETPDPLFLTSFDALSDFLDTISRGDSIVSQLPAPGEDYSESPTNRIPLGIESRSLLNIQQLLELRWRPTQSNMVWKGGARFDEANCREFQFTKLDLKEGTMEEVTIEEGTEV